MKRGYLVGGLLIILCATTAAFTLRGAGTPHLTFADAQKSGESCQIYGKLVKDSVRMEQAMTQTRFQLVEKETGQRLDVLYQNSAEPVAANFASATDVRAGSRGTARMRRSPAPRSTPASAQPAARGRESRSPS